jgi:very-short-patch-repair endonuclease
VLVAHSGGLRASRPALGFAILGAVTNQWADLLNRQSGVISRKQALALGASAPDVRRWIRRREMAVILPGCLVEHTGPPTWLQRAWAAVLVCEPAALGFESALTAAGPARQLGHPGPIRVVVDAARKLCPPPGISVTRQRHLADRVLWEAAPPRLRLEEAALDLAAATEDPLSAIALLTDLCGARRTTPARLAATLASRDRIPHGPLLRSVVADLSAGTHSVLEHAYLTKVERAHCLPEGRRQVRQVSDSGVVYRDVLYDVGVAVELDGRGFHSSATQRDRDLARDLELAGLGFAVVRLGYSQVLGQPCRTAAGIAEVLSRREWPGSVRACGPSCTALAGSRPLSSC